MHTSSDPEGPFVGSYMRKEEWRIPVWLLLLVYGRYGDNIYIYSRLLRVVSVGQKLVRRQGWGKN